MEPIELDWSVGINNRVNVYTGKLLGVTSIEGFLGKQAFCQKAWVFPVGSLRARAIMTIFVTMCLESSLRDLKRWK